MKRTISVIAISLVCGIVALGVLVLRPVPIIDEQEAQVVESVVVDIYEGGVNDVVFKLDDNDTRYYINRGLESGMKIAELKEKLIGNRIILKHPDYWTPLDWNKSSRHIAKLQYNNEVIFSEWK